LNRYRPLMVVMATRNTRRSSNERAQTAEEKQRSIEHALFTKRGQPADLPDVIPFLGLGAAMATGQMITAAGGWPDRQNGPGDQPQGMIPRG
jgi:hypothetical protein